MLAKLTIVATVTLCLGGTVHAGDREYDWRSGDTRYSYEDRDGNTRISGRNWREREYWSTTIAPDGTQRGYDADGNMWRYNGNHFWSADGRSCFGSAAARGCKSIGDYYEDGQQHDLGR
jgi:hypothetical protein